jgi:hypothetical protein
LSYEVASDSCDLVRGCRCFGCGRRIVRQKDQEIPHRNAHADSRAKTSETQHKESFTDSISQPVPHGVAKTEEDLADSVSEPNTQIKAQTSVPNANSYA